MLRTLLAMLLAFALAVPARADEPSTDEPMPKQPAVEQAPATTATTAAPATPAPAEPAPAATAPATQVAAPKLAPDGTVDEIIPNPPKKYAFAFGGAALGCLLIGGILGGVALQRSNEQSGNVAMPPLYTHDLQQRGTLGTNLATSSYVFFAAGAALAVTDIVLWYETFRKPRVVKRTPEGVTMNTSGGKL